MAKNLLTYSSLKDGMTTLCDLFARSAYASAQKGPFQLKMLQLHHDMENGLLPYEEEKILDDNELVQLFENYNLSATAALVAISNVYPIAGGISKAQAALIAASEASDEHFTLEPETRRFADAEPVFD